ncbi:hypothetical protein GGS21DRAFT_540843 [Xylaria nigripes]|nr:hypothetical protein GGS21DRAFT_540843 [Xylaria nigripes]
MSFFQKTACVMLLGVMGMAELAHAAVIRSKNSEATTLYQPTMYRVYPNETGRSSGPAVSQLEVQRSDNVSLLENIAVFERVPATATTCTLGWDQAARAQRTDFFVDGNGLLAAQQLSRLPEGEISWDSIAPITEEAVEQGKPLLHPDTTSWPEVESAWSHIAGPVNCAETVYLKIQIDDRDGAGFVYLGQDARNGLTLKIQ